MEAKAEPRNEKGQTLAEFLAAYSRFPLQLDTRIVQPRI